MKSQPAKKLPAQKLKKRLPNAGPKLKNTVPKKKYVPGSIKRGYTKYA